jgi:hypothetical protein
MAKRANGVMEYVYTEPVLKFDFGSGLVVSYNAEWNFPTFLTMSDCQKRVIVNGLKQRLSDRVAGGESASSRYDTMKATADSLKANIYSTRSIGTAAAIKAAEAAFELKTAIETCVYALVAVSGKPEAACLSFVAKKSIEWMRAFMVEPKYAVAVAEYRKSLVAEVVIDTAEIDAIE